MAKFIIETETDEGLADILDLLTGSNIIQASDILSTSVESYKTAVASGVTAAPIVADPVVASDPVVTPAVVAVPPVTVEPVTDPVVTPAADASAEGAAASTPIVPVEQVVTTDPTVSASSSIPTVQ